MKIPPETFFMNMTVESMKYYTIIALH